jgi:hypothetical protein
MIHVLAGVLNAVDLNGGLRYERDLPGYGTADEERLVTAG